MPRRVVVLHFNPPNFDKRLARLSDFAVEAVISTGPDDLKPLRERPPDALIVDLDPRPSEGVPSPCSRRAGLWICWPKKASGAQSDLDQAQVRRYAMDRSLVDFKVAAIDTTWSGLRFSRKKR